MKQRRRYDDEFRASAVLMLEAAGYPEREGALSQVAGHLNVARSTLRSWFNGTHNPPPAKVRHEKKRDFVADLKHLLGLHIDAAGRVVDDTGDLRALDTGIGILVDKIQLLDGKPTWRGEVIDLLKSGAVTRDEVTEELGDELASELFDAAGINRA